MIDEPKEVKKFYALLLEVDDTLLLDDDDNIIFFDGLDEAGAFCIDNGINFEDVRLKIFTGDDIITEAVVDEY